MAAPAPRAYVVYGNHNPTPRTTSYESNGSQNAYADAPTDVAHDVATTSRGWDLLARGRKHEALLQLATEAKIRPKSGGTKVGYALAAAVSGRLERGVWAMRRALRTDPYGVRDVQIDDRLRSQVEGLIDQYAYTYESPEEAVDGAFMSAALHFLLRDVELADDAITAAVRSDDRKSSTENLQHMIKEALAAQRREEDDSGQRTTR